MTHCPFSSVGRFEERCLKAQQDRAAESIVDKGGRDPRIPKEEDDAN